MLFNSIDFAVFFPLVFLIYWLIINRSLKYQNLFIVLVSFVFYGWWDWRFLLLLISSSLINYFIGISFREQGSSHKQKILLWIALIYNIGLLVAFKYLNFFVDSFSSAFTLLGYPVTGYSLKIVLPVGISFFTFLALGYIIEVYRKNITPERNIISFAAFVSFFPLILAGPIERADHLLPQFSQKRCFSYSHSTDGLRQILWGLFKKIVIADNCAIFVNAIFLNSSSYNGSTLILGAVFYTIQIYADFSGYSDMAIGVSRLLGFNVVRNFNFPYLALNITDFWRRWHMSLSSWLRDYIFTPLSIGLRTAGKIGLVVSLLLTFLICGLWHGANYTFVIWGGFHGLALAFEALTVKTRKNLRSIIHPVLYNSISWSITFVFIVFTWIFFRVEKLSEAFSYISGILSRKIFAIPYFPGRKDSLWVIMIVFVFGLIEWVGRKQEYAIENLGLSWRRPFRYAFYYLIIISILWYGGREQQFIYFQF